MKNKLLIFFILIFLSSTLKAENLFIESNPIPVKWALYKMDKCRKGIRLPLLMLSEESQPAVLNDLEELGVL